MKSKWKVSSNIINGTTKYIVYRLYDADEPDHSGNREYSGGYTTDCAIADELAAELNAER